VPEALIATIVSYVPRMVVRRHARDAAGPLKPEETYFPAAVVFVDVSGFTRLAERLAQQGPEGAEELTRVLNAHFGPLIDCIHAYAGDVVKFAGDALVVVWQAPSEAELREVVSRASACSLGLQDVMGELAARGATGGSEPLSIKVTVGCGEMRIAQVGGVSGRWEIMVTGHALSDIGEIAHDAEPGRVLVTRGVGRLLGEAMTVAGTVHAGDPLRSSRPLVGPEQALPSDATAPVGYFITAVDGPGPDVDEFAGADEDVERLLGGFLPEAVTSRLAARQSGWLSELRRVTVMFVNFPNAKHDTTLERAQGVMALIQTVLDRHEGMLNKLSVDEKGVSMVAAFGLPPLSHEDDAARAIAAGFALQEILRKHEVVHAIGMSTGRAFCGVVGNDRRREYTVMGDIVNLAARLMQAAKQDLLCDQATMQLAAGRFAFEALPPISVKGKAEPVTLFRPGMAASPKVHAAKADGEMVGRTAELQVLREALAASGGTIVIEGEAGIGKSRLVAAFAELARSSGQAALIGAGDAIERSSPYHAWRSVFQAYVDVDALPQSLPDAHLRDFAPLLGPVLGVEIPDTDATRDMAGIVRGDNTRDLLVSLLRHEAGKSRLILILEDAHWFDSASWALALDVSRTLREVLLVLALRPPGDAATQEYRRIAADPATRTLRLSSLSTEDTLTLVSRRLGVAALPEDVARLIVERSAGHPFFSEELAYALRDSGSLQVDNGTCRLAEGADLKALTFPDTVQGAITSRVDRLPPAVQLTLKVASVIGRVFAVETLRAVHPIDGESEALPDHLQTLERLDLTPLEAPDPELAYIFKHIITQQVVYDLMLFAQRQSIHRAVAEYHERRHSADLAGLYPILAHHWGKTGDAGKTQFYLDGAGDLALQSGAYQEAVAFLEKADLLEGKAMHPTARGTAFLHHKPSAEPHPAAHDKLRRARRQRLLGDALISLGRLDDSQKCLAKAAELLGWPLPETPADWAICGGRHVLWQLRNHKMRNRYLGHLAGMKEELLEASRAFERLGPIYFWRNEPLKTLYSALSGLNLSEWAGPSAELAKSYANMCVGTSLVPLRGLAETYERCAREAIEGLDNLPARCWILECVGLHRSGRGDWDAAIAALDEASAIAEKLGDVRRNEECMMIQAVIRLEFGQYEAASAVYERAAQSGRVRGDAHVLGGALSGLAYCLTMQGRAQDALAVLEEAEANLRKANAVPEGIGLLATSAHAHAIAGHDAVARDLAVEALSRMEKVMPTAVYTIEAYSELPEAFSILRSRADSPELRHLAGRALKQLQRAARTFPFANTRWQYWKGVDARLSGNRAAARKHWQEAERLAGRFKVAPIQAAARERLAEP
jgi:class 3 adenylate cyclase/tetratricopeptide (TPR) repeat protein